MHVHTIHSGMCTLPVLRAVCRESYSDPEALYVSLKQKGMDLVTVTDHDSIDAVEPLRNHSDFFLSEEVTCRMPSGTELHVGVYDINERQHQEIQRRRDDFHALLAYLNEQGLLFSANHIFSSLTGKRTRADFDWFADAFPALETQNGCMLAAINRGAQSMASKMDKIAIGGSDAHTVRSAATCWTTVPGAGTKSEFMQGLRSGRSRVDGSSGNYFKLTRDVLQIGCEMMQADPRTAPIAFLSGFAPLITLGNYFMEIGFARRWVDRVVRECETRPAQAMASEVAA